MNDTKESKEIQRLNHFLKTLEGKERELISSYAENKLSFEQFMQLKDYIESEKVKTLNQLDELSATKEELVIEREDIIKNFKENWELLTDSEKRLFLLKFVDKIVIVNEMRNSRRGNVKIIDVTFHTESC